MASSAGSVEDLAVLVLAGGAGTRFWPVSTESRPKQFLPLLGRRTMLQLSVDRVLGLVPPERVVVLTGEAFVELAREQLPHLPPANVVGEPVRRDTAAAVTLGVLLLERMHGRGVMAVLTADHRIEPVARFHRDLLSAADGARANPRALYTFGIVPSFPSTGYGYLHRGEPLSDRVPRHFRLRRFEEKPPRAVAERYVASGEHYWNSGMFVWSHEAILAELEGQLPGHLQALAPAAAAYGTGRFSAALAAAFEGLPGVSIDFAVMEGARDVRCVEATFEWSDVGGWVALEAFLPSAEGNAVHGRVHALGATRNIVFNEDPDEDVALVGVSDLVVVRAGKRTLVCRREDAESIKQLVAGLPSRLR